MSMGGSMNNWCLPRLGVDGEWRPPADGSSGGGGAEVVSEDHLWILAVVAALRRGW